MHQRLDSVLGQARPAKTSHDPSARGRRLRRALSCSTALVAVGLLGTLLVAAPPATAGGGGGASGLHKGNVRGGGGSGGSNDGSNMGGAGVPGTYGGGGGGGGTNLGNGGAGGKDSRGYGGGGGTGGQAGFGYSQPGGYGGGGSGGAGGGGGGAGGVGYFAFFLPNGHVTGGDGGLGGTGSNLTNPTGLAIGTVPPGVNPSALAVQTSVSAQVNLVNSTGVILHFWDGSTQSGNGHIDGGDGTWTASSASTNWTDANGGLNDPWQNGHFAIFEAQAGTVTVDDSGGAIAVTGMQFATNGYQIEGDAITLGSPETIIRVGFGSASGAGVTATIASVLTGTGGLEKTDFGTLVLTGANNYTGGTTVREGTLQLGDGGTSGSIVGEGRARRCSPAPTPTAAARPSRPARCRSPLTTISAPPPAG